MFNKGFWSAFFIFEGLIFVFNSLKVTLKASLILFYTTKSFSKSTFTFLKCFSFNLALYSHSHYFASLFKTKVCYFFNSNSLQSFLILLFELQVPSKFISESIAMLLAISPCFITISFFLLSCLCFLIDTPTLIEAVDFEVLSIGYLFPFAIFSYLASLFSFISIFRTFLS